MKRLTWVLAAVLLSAAFHVLTVKTYPYYVMLKLARHAQGALNTIRHDPGGFPRKAGMWSGPVLTSYIPRAAMTFPGGR